MRLLINWWGVGGLGLVMAVGGCSGDDGGATGVLSGGGLSTTGATSTSDGSSEGPTEATSTSSSGSESDSNTTMVDPPPGICGDGVVDEGELCDEGEANGDDKSCTSSCALATCGDGLVQAGVEACDAGDANGDDKACTSSCALAVCGDGLVHEGVEACDDGNDDDLDACSNSCVLGSCGDGVVQEGEPCDDGDGIDTNECTNACTLAACGDGVIYEGVEACDEGEENGDSKACTSACALAVCGDGLVHEGVEECDDANEDNTDMCTNACAAAKCGDGFVQAGEECDDGNGVNNDGCSSLCKVEFCFSLKNTGAEDLNNNTWLDACLAAPGANVKVRLLDGNNNVVYEATGAKVGVWTADQWTSTTTPANQYLVSNHNRLVTLNNGDKLMVAGRNSSNSGCGGSFGNGYGIVIYPANPNYYSNPKMIVMPFRHQVGNVNQRSFTGWTMNHEISWNNGNAMNTCNGPLTGFAGTFQLQITP